MKSLKKGKISRKRRPSEITSHDRPLRSSENSSNLIKTPSKGDVIDIRIKSKNHPFNEDSMNSIIEKVEQENVKSPEKIKEAKRIAFQYDGIN